MSASLIEADLVQAEIVWTMTIIIVCMILGVYLRLRVRTPVPPPHTPFRYDDRHWKLGWFYHNPNDPDPLVPPRRRLQGWFVPNYGHPVVRVVVIVWLVVFVAWAVFLLLHMVPPSFQLQQLVPGNNGPR